MMVGGRADAMRHEQDRDDEPCGPFGTDLLSLEAYGQGRSLPESWFKGTNMTDERPDDPVSLKAENNLLRARVELLELAGSKVNQEVCQTLGRALGYPRFCDDQKNFPGATDGAGVCVGEHVAESIAGEAAGVIVKQRELIARDFKRVRAGRDDLRRKLEFVGRAASGGDHPSVVKGHPCWSEELEKVRALSDAMDAAVRAATGSIHGE